jgi:DNA-binding beta-propeller fold protein YncE
MASWWITFHGGGASAGDDGDPGSDDAAAPAAKAPIHNIQTFDTTGTLQNAGILATGIAGEPAFDELRGFVFAGAGVLVANASGSASSVLSFAPPAAPAWGFSQGVFISDNLTHPFDIVVGPSGDFFVSNQSHKDQGGNDITFYHPHSGAYKGTFAKGFTKLRGLAYDGTSLYAADTGAGTVTIYDANGKQTGSLSVSDACHLLYDGTRYLYVASEKHGIFSYDTQASSAGGKHGVQPFLDAKQANPPLSAIAGLAFGDDDAVYVCDRDAKIVARYPLVAGSDPPACNPAGTTFIGPLDDSPEFIRAGP